MKDYLARIFLYKDKKAYIQILNGSIIACSPIALFTLLASPKEFAENLYFNFDLCDSLFPYGELRMENGPGFTLGYFFMDGSLEMISYEIFQFMHNKNLYFSDKQLDFSFLYAGNTIYTENSISVYLKAYFEASKDRNVFIKYKYDMSLTEDQIKTFKLQIADALISSLDVKRLNTNIDNSLENKSEECQKISKEFMDKEKSYQLISPEEYSRYYGINLQIIDEKLLHNEFESQILTPNGSWLLNKYELYKFDDVEYTEDYIKACDLYYSSTEWISRLVYSQIYNVAFSTVQRWIVLGIIKQTKEIDGKVFVYKYENPPNKYKKYFPENIPESLMRNSLNSDIIPLNTYGKNYGVTSATLYYHISCGNIKTAFKKGKRWYINKKEPYPKHKIHNDSKKSKENKLLIKQGNDYQSIQEYIERKK